MSFLVKIFKQVPEFIFQPAVVEVVSTDWNNLPVLDRRPSTSVFRTSISNHLRIHAFAEGLQRTREALSETTACEDTIARKIFTSVNNLAEWVIKEVSASEVGRIMVVNLLPNSIIPNHIDTGLYFQTYYRFHIPIITNELVKFTGPCDDVHMPVGTLCQLNNRDFHGVKNMSESSRYHLIIDLKTSDERFVL